mmetsp:Transcript_9661/g.13305  ORF Transcript_9661/g.13305 Transcript_9661/m.13305 type:complete len:252 (-) Transcript_9661:33-788(-)
MQQPQEIFGESEQNSDTWSKWSITIDPVLKYELKDKSKTVQIVQNHKGFGELGSRVWEGSLILSRLVEKMGPDFFKNKRCIELGSGTGLLGIIAALMGAQVTLTDKASLLKLIQLNVDSNTADNLEVRKNITAQELFWGTEITDPNLKDHFDVVLGADLTYIFEDLPILLDTMKQLLRRGEFTSTGNSWVPNNTSVILLAYGKERAAIPTFFELAAKDFEVVKIIDENELDFSDTPNPTFSINVAIMKRKL